ncbi:hypothetical protein BJV74DRAFT_813839 [Russula compacta]|nr:hypothetical protein BJV74DRAFT_813839 [Russula compacta]
MLFLSIAINYLPPKWYKSVFRFSIFIIMLDFFLCLIWLPIAVHNTYGFRSAKFVFTSTCTSSREIWPCFWPLHLGTLTGFDASGHVAEETKNASVVASRGIITSTIATGVLGLITTILFLFCIPDLDAFFALDAPQPFNTSVAVVASSRLLYAVARDGVLPLSGWIGRVSADGQPKNAVTVMFVFAAVLLCTVLPSQVAFTSLISAGGVPTIAAYGLIALLRLTRTPNAFKKSHFYLGRWAKPMYVSTVLFNGLIFAVMISPFYFPVTASTFNFASVIFGSVTIFAILTWYYTPADQWLRQEQIERAMRTADGQPDAIETSAVLQRE